MRLQSAYRVLLAVTAGAAAARGTALPSSLHMIESLMARGQGVTSSGAVTGTLESGLLALALADAVTHYPASPPASRYADYLGRVLAAAAPDLRDAARDATKPLDRFSIHTGIDAARRAVGGAQTAGEAVTAAYDAVNASLALQARNPDGGLWYYVYPEWSYLDGLFSLLPFMAAATAPRPNYTDMVLQLRLVARHCYDDASGLYFHGYDWARKAVWADAATGASPYVWGRSLGWFLAGLVQTWDALDCRRDERARGGSEGGGGDDERSALCAEVKRIVGAAAPRLVSYADGETGVWWQLPTVGAARPGNFLESSSTALFVFSLLKARRLGLLAGAGGARCCGAGCGDGDTIRRAALRAYDYTRERFVTDTGNGTIGFDKTVAVCSLNSTATFEYYTSRPLVPNGLLGEAAFVLASLEVEKLSV
ncbi:cell wall glycosyl hydrolase YteR [Cordyceps javanica]|uniref:Cell wall glycosyl hydrolase YteR n=1 Tax=Cordyceps javanica TaxID=43265 RepID=A0A545W5T4_9HYPO|nr:cell wall glycosyl hydrolase YteR [Cordyceps javanica]TQW09341.1 cell wall glycosyl hydrolase YteR [Cordyceps javanica]